MIGRYHGNTYLTRGHHLGRPVATVGCVAIVYLIVAHLGPSYFAFEARRSVGDERRLLLLAQQLCKTRMLDGEASDYVDPLFPPNFQNMRTWKGRGSGGIACHEYSEDGTRVRVKFFDNALSKRGSVLLHYADYGEAADYDMDGNWEVVVGFPVNQRGAKEVDHYEYALVRFHKDSNEILAILGVRRKSVMYGKDPRFPVWCDSDGNGIYELYERGGASINQFQPVNVLVSWKEIGGELLLEVSEDFSRSLDRLPITLNEDEDLAERLSELSALE